MTRERPRASRCPPSPLRSTLVSRGPTQLRSCDPGPPPGGRGGRNGARALHPGSCRADSQIAAAAAGHSPTRSTQPRRGWQTAQLIRFHFSLSQPSVPSHKHEPLISGDIPFPPRRISKTSASTQGVLASDSLTPGGCCNSFLAYTPALFHQSHGCTHPQGSVGIY